MKIIFDNLGAVREGDYANEIINQGSHNVNKIYFAIENEEAQNNYLNYIATASFTFSNQESVSDVVMSATRFSFNDVEYNGYLLSLGKTLTAISGETSITFRVKDNSGNTILTTQPIVKTITRTDGNNKVINITEAQYESLLEAVNNKVSVESGEAKNLKVKGILTIEAENGQSVNIECYGQDELKVPTLCAENINGNKVYGEQGTFGSITLDDISDSDIPLKIINYKGSLYRNENAEGYQYLIKSEIETKDAETLNSAKSYTDAEKTKVLSESKTYTDRVFANGQTYTNNEINKIKDGTYLVGKAEKDINGNRIDLTYQGKTLSVQIGSYTTVEQALQGLKQEIEVLIGGTISQEDLDTLKEISDAVFKAQNDITALQEAINDIVLSNVPVATQNTAGIVKIGNNINVTADGTISIDLSSYALKSELPTNISQLNNDSGFITNGVNNLQNYYTKEEIDTTCLKQGDNVTFNAMNVNSIAQFFGDVNLSYGKVYVQNLLTTDEKSYLEANPELNGTEENLTSVTISGRNYKINSNGDSSTNPVISQSFTIPLTQENTNIDNFKRELTAEEIAIIESKPEKLDFNLIINLDNEGVTLATLDSIYTITQKMTLDGMLNYDGYFLIGISGTGTADYDHTYSYVQISISKQIGNQTYMLRINGFTRAERQADGYTAGVVNPTLKTAEMTQAIGVDTTDGRLYTKASLTIDEVQALIDNAIGNVLTEEF